MSFQLRQKDLKPTTPIRITRLEEGQVLEEGSLVDRPVPQMPTGMEKEEEAEHHLQQAIVAGTAIPTPEVTLVANYEKLYPADCQMPKQLITTQPFLLEDDAPDYDMDSEDEELVTSQKGKLELTPDKFEAIMDKLENGSGQTVVTLQEAKALIKEDDDLITAIHDYWINKKLKVANPQHSLIPQVRTEAKPGMSNNNPYICFRRRTEKMQTRKNRKKDESHYGKMVKLKRDLTRAHDLMEIVKKREKSKRELLHVDIEVFERRTKAEDFSGEIVSEATQQLPARPAFTPLCEPNYFSLIKEKPLPPSLGLKVRGPYKKRQPKSSAKSPPAATSSVALSKNAQMEPKDGDDSSSSSDDNEVIVISSTSESEVEDDDPFAFRRRSGCEYIAPSDNNDLEWQSKEEVDTRYKFYPTSVPDVAGEGYKLLGPCRRRVGRGGRVLLNKMAIHDVRRLCRTIGYDPTEAITGSSRSSPSPAESSDSDSDSVVKAFPVSSRPIKSNARKSPSSPPPSPDTNTSSLSCGHNFRPKTPDMLESPDLPLPDPEALNDESVEASNEETDLAAFTGGLEPSYHLGLVVSSGEPLSYPVESLSSDPPLHQDPLASNIETLGDLVLLENIVELEEGTILLLIEEADVDSTYYVVEEDNAPSLGPGPTSPPPPVQSPPN